MTLRACLTAIALAATPAAAAEPFPGYDRVCGYRIVVTPTLTVAQAVVSVTGEPLILLDPLLFTPSEAARRVFLTAHECAHHKLGHSDDDARAARAGSARVVRDQEMSADCWAAETLARSGESKAIRIMADRLYRAGFYSPGGGYPSGLQRSSIIFQCAKSGQNAQITRETPAD